MGISKRSVQKLLLIKILWEKLQDEKKSVESRKNNKRLLDKRSVRYFFVQMGS